MDWETLYCPNKRCKYYGWPFRQGKLVKNGSSYGQPKALCKECWTGVALSYATAYYGLERDPAIFETAVRALAEGNSIRATGRILQIDKDTVCGWLNRAALHCRSVVLYLGSHLQVTECQLDELWGFVHTKAAHLAFAKIYCETYGDAWVWLAFAPGWRLVLAFVVGKRNQESADLLLERVKNVTNEHIPCLTSDRLPEYEDALLHTYGTWVPPERKGSRGRFPNPRLIPGADLLDAQVVKVRENGRVTEVKTKVIFGKPEASAAQLADSPVNDAVNTSFVERDNLTQRQSNRRLTRRTNGFSKEIAWFEKQLWLSTGYYHLVLPHHSLRQPLEPPEPTRGTGTPKKWKPVTPAMAAGLTDHVWTTAELLSYRVPAQFVDQLSQIKPLFTLLEAVHH
ncbi:MAG: helix-turn-helix domain-containing protein [Ardenticatenaceae bacterium]|nr:helix-turn-helix domain-containing protein [Ardenticatenaceae bacterium]